MFTANIINNNTVPNAVAGNGAAAPETAGFDFMSYLLGLQTVPNGNPQALPTDGSTDALTSLLGSSPPVAGTQEVNPQKKDNSPWNLLFPGMPMTGQPAVVGQIETKGGEGQQDVAVRQLDALLAKLNIEVPKETEDAAPEMAITGLEVFSAAPAQGPIVSDTPSQQQPTFQGSLAQLKEQGRLAEQTVAAQAAPAQTAVGRYARMAEAAGPETAYATAPSVEMADQPVPTGELYRKRTDPTAANPATTGIDGTLTAGASHGHGAKDLLSATNPTPPQPLHTVADLKSRIETMAHNGGGKMTVQLSPPELGKVEVQVLTRGKRVEVRMASESIAAKSALESSLGELRRSLEGQNLQLTHADVRHGSETLSGSHSGFDQQQQHFAGQGSGFETRRDERGGFGDRGSQQGGFARRNAGGIAAVEPAVIRPSYLGAGRVDVRI